ncbi:response regulator [Alloacidobacterium dinghuense]|uniref:Response regulator n=1 Tax=Alloacidobacterium dinghuense TaxID=2763107 RepID=A0A7G8BHA2_9BACT|nr:response regulator [Alloacidobacterium dinghuense]QNI31922.1 response regulator [Alloacidobacterium dinghuense]
MKRRILLVDDELAVLLTLKAVLEINGFEVETAASAREAKSKIKNAQYHMVITDMRMESESAGLEVVQTAKKAAYQPAVAMLTAFPIPGEDWQAEGADEMLVKPMNTQDLLVQIEALLVTHEDNKRGSAKKQPELVTADTPSTGKARASTRKAIATS